VIGTDAVFDAEQVEQGSLVVDGAAHA